MALVKCKECGKEVSTAAAACPSCGAPRTTTAGTIAKTASWVWLAVKLFVGAIMLVFIYTCTQVVTRDRVSDAVPASPVSGTSAVAPTGCTASDFKVSGEKMRPEGGRFLLTATLTNHGSIACGAQLKLTSFDKSGAVLATTDFWPASVRNISPGVAEHFTYHLEQGPEAATYEVRVIDARPWNK